MTDKKKFEWGAHSLNKGLSFEMYDGRTATLIAHGRTPFEWLVMFSDSTSNVLTEEFILDRLNGPTPNKEDKVGHTIPVVMFLRPNGRRQNGSIRVPAEYETPEKLTVLEAKLAELDSCGIMITTEDIPGDQASVCMDDGDFDYKTALFDLGEALAGQITEFVLSFDVYDYRKAKRAFEDGEDMFGKEEDTHDGHPITKEGEDGG